MVLMGNNCFLRQVEETVTVVEIDEETYEEVGELTALTCVLKASYYRGGGNMDLPS